MNRTVLVFIISLSVAGCGKHLSQLTAVDDCITNNPEFIPATVPTTDNYSLVIHENASLDLFQNGDELVPQIENGNKLVFEYLYKKSVNPMMVDAGYTEHILFEIDALSKSFLLSGSALEAAKAMYGNLCFCIDAGYYPIKSGCIKGKKSGKNSWEIEMIIKAFGNTREFSKMLSEKFVIVK